MPVSKSRRKKIPPKRSAKTETVAPLPDRRAMESFLAALSGRPRNEALAKAQDVMYQAWENSSLRTQAAMARKALAISPLCADAFNLLGEQAKSVEEALDLYTRGVEAGALALGPEGFEEYAGHFWGFLETRPYMRALAGLADALQRLGDEDNAIGHYREMLKLNPNDNQGIRDVLAALLLKREDVAALKELLAGYQEDGSAAWVYTRTLLAFRDGGASDENALNLAKEAWAANEHVPGILAGTKPALFRLGDYITMGGPDEATHYVKAFGPAWRRTDGAIVWLTNVTSDLPPKRRPGAGRDDP
jgi:tetratricopeptide (TPR) repeat protein